MNATRFIAILATLPTAFAASAATINFDDLATDEDLLGVPSNYQGLGWEETNFWGTIDDTFYASFGNSYGSPSGAVAVYNMFGVLNMSITSGSTFDFIGAYFTGLAHNDSFTSSTSTSITVFWLQQRWFSWQCQYGFVCQPV